MSYLNSRNCGYCKVREYFLIIADRPYNFSNGESNIARNFFREREKAQMIVTSIETIVGPSVDHDLSTPRSFDDVAFRKISRFGIIMGVPFMGNGRAHLLSP